MIRKNFYRALAKIADQFYWTNDSTGMIRGNPKNQKNKNLWCCPITALHYARTGNWIYSAHYKNTGAQLGLSEQDSSVIAASADYDYDQEYLDSLDKHTKAKVIKNIRCREAIIKAIS